MTSDVRQGIPFVLARDDLSDADREAILHGAGFARIPCGIVGMAGPGVMDCLQGVLTNDVHRYGVVGFLYGAVLTPKGMIISPVWVARMDPEVLVYCPPEGLGKLLRVFERALPPRLVQYRDQSDWDAVFHIAGLHGVDQAAKAGVDIPPQNHTVEGGVNGVDIVACQPLDARPFAIQVVCEEQDADAVAEGLEAGGVRQVAPAALELERVLAGWPRLGAEINERTLPQEVRFDELGGVSYSKGCYTGQETVARVHFRGHVNRQLVGLEWPREPDPANDAISRANKVVGRVTSVVWLQPPARHIGLGIVRRGVVAGDEVLAAGQPAIVHALPFGPL